jgi:hypothetical protein
MNKSQAEDLIFQIQLVCPLLDYSGTYSASELRLKLTPMLDKESREKVRSIVSKFGQNMREENGAVIIYEPGK